MKPSILAILPGLIPSTIINITTPLVDLHRAGLVKARITLEMFVKDKDIEWSDLIILCRNVEPEGIRRLLKILDSKKPYVYDIDDNFFELPINTLLGKYHRSPERIAMLEEYIRHADLVRVYSEPMLRRAKSLNLYSVKVNGTVDWRLVKFAPQTNEKKTIKIVYATSRVNDNLAEIFKPALIRVLKNYKKLIQVYFLGYNPTEFKSYPNVFFKPINLNYKRYLRDFSNSGFDIGLAPLLDDVFHRSKTNLKVREYGACHIAGIYSDVDTYSTSVTHKKNGLLVKNTPDEWYSAMSLLIENRELRTQIQDEAYQFAVENFSQEAFAQLWYSQITEILNKSTRLTKNNYTTKQLNLLQDQVYVPETSGYFNESISELRSASTTLHNLRVKSGFITILNPIRKWMLQFWIGRKIIRLVSELKTHGLAFVLTRIKVYIQMLWLLLKIKLIIVFSKN